MSLGGQLWTYGYGGNNAAGILYMNSAGTKYLYQDGTNFSFGGAPLYVPSGFTGNIVANSGSVIAAGGGVLISRAASGGSAFTFYQAVDGSNQWQQYWNGTDGYFYSSHTSAGGYFIQTYFGRFSASYGYQCKQGISGGFGGNSFNFDYSAGNVQCWIDNSFMGNIAFSSDYRLKDNVEDLSGTWDLVKRLRPIAFTWGAHELIKGSKIEARPDEPQWGFLAHELQETLIKSAATGEKDAENLIQSPNPWTIIAALTKTLQEAMARIEALEGA